MQQSEEQLSKLTAQRAGACTCSLLCTLGIAALRDGSAKLVCRVCVVCLVHCSFVCALSGKLSSRLMTRVLKSRINMRQYITNTSVASRDAMVTDNAAFETPLACLQSRMFRLQRLTQQTRPRRRQRWRLQSRRWACSSKPSSSAAGGRCALMLHLLFTILALSSSHAPLSPCAPRTPQATRRCCCAQSRVNGAPLNAAHRAAFTIFIALHLRAARAALAARYAALVQSSSHACTSLPGNYGSQRELLRQRTASETECHLRLHDDHSHISHGVEQRCR